MVLPEPKAEVGRGATLWRTVRAVAWSFLGVRKNSEYQEDLARVNPLHVILVGIIGAVLLVLLLVSVARWVVSP